MTSTHSHSSGKAEFRLRKEQGWQNAPSKTATLGFERQGDSGDLWGFTASCVSGMRLAGRGQHPRLGDWKCEVKCQRLSSSNTYGFHSLLPPSCVGSGRYNHWAGPGKYQHDGKGYCHIHWCWCHILHLSREREMAVRLLAAPVAPSPIPSSAKQKSEAGPMINSSGAPGAVRVKCRTVPGCLNKAFEVYQKSKFGFLIVLKESILFCA